MKHLLFSLIAFVYLYNNVSAQNTLEFNQVLLVNSNVQTVPAGKVWKVENVLPTTAFRYTSSSGTGPYEYAILVNGNSRYVGHSALGNSYYQAALPGQTDGVPFWLPAGTTLAAGSNVGEISVIEFNVVP